MNTDAVDTDHDLKSCRPQYSIKLPANPGILLPGLWMLFVVDAAGVPSVSKDVRIKPLAAASPAPAAAPVATPAVTKRAQPATLPAFGSAGALQPAASAGG